MRESRVDDCRICVRSDDAIRAIGKQRVDNQCFPASGNRHAGFVTSVCRIFKRHFPTRTRQYRHAFLIAAGRLVVESEARNHYIFCSGFNAQQRVCNAIGVLAVFHHGRRAEILIVAHARARTVNIKIVEQVLAVDGFKQISRAARKPLPRIIAVSHIDAFVAQLSSRRVGERNDGAAQVGNGIRPTRTVGQTAFLRSHVDHIACRQKIHILVFIEAYVDRLVVLRAVFTQRAGITIIVAGNVIVFQGFQIVHKPSDVCPLFRPRVGPQKPVAAIGQHRYRHRIPQVHRVVAGHSGTACRPRESRTVDCHVLGRNLDVARFVLRLRNIAGIVACRMAHHPHERHVLGFRLVAPHQRIDYFAFVIAAINYGVHGRLVACKCIVDQRNHRCVGRCEPFRVVCSDCTAAARRLVVHPKRVCRIKRGRGSSLRHACQIHGAAARRLIFRWRHRIVHCAVAGKDRCRNRQSSIARIDCAAAHGKVVHEAAIRYRVRHAVGIDSTATAGIAARCHFRHFICRLSRHHRHTVERHFARSLAIYHVESAPLFARSIDVARENRLRRHFPRFEQAVAVHVRQFAAVQQRVDRVVRLKRHRSRCGRYRPKSRRIGFVAAEAAINGYALRNAERVAPLVGRSRILFSHNPIFGFINAAGHQQLEFNIIAEFLAHRLYVVERILYPRHRRVERPSHVVVGIFAVGQKHVGALRYEYALDHVFAVVRNRYDTAVESIRAGVDFSLFGTCRNAWRPDHVADCYSRMFLKITLHFHHRAMLHQRRIRLQRIETCKIKRFVACHFRILEIARQLVSLYETVVERIKFRDRAARCRSQEIVGKHGISRAAHILVGRSRVAPYDRIDSRHRTFREIDAATLLRCHIVGNRVRHQMGACRRAGSRIVDINARAGLCRVCHHIRARHQAARHHVQAAAFHRAAIANHAVAHMSPCRDYGASAACVVASGRHRCRRAVFNIQPVDRRREPRLRI